MAPQKITVETEVPVAPNRAWELYTNPDDVMQWNFAIDDWHCPAASIDLRVGGTHNARMEAKNGSFGFDFAGTYTEVDEPHSLTLVLGDGRQSRTTFRASAEGTVVETIFDAESDQLPDVYSIASGFIRLYLSVESLDKLPNCKWLKQTYLKEADELLVRFILVNLFLTDHGKKLEAFSEIRCELNKQIGETDYTYRKVLHLQAFNANIPQSYAFLKD